MRQLVRRHKRFFIAATLAGFALRLIFLWKLSFIAGDSFVYGDLARNWIEHGTYAMTDAGALLPTFLRLPGYPAFLALIWLIFGVEHYTAVIVAQIIVDVGTCFLVSALALRVATTRAALVAFLLAALCPFTANYAVTPLTETLAIFFSALALLCAVQALDRPGGLRWWIGCGLALAYSILLRPDGGLLLAAIFGYLLVAAARGPRRARKISAAALVSLVALGPLVPWTIRNWRMFHVFQPLAPRYANNPDEYVAAGFNRWTKTWIVDYVSVEDIYWRVPGEAVEISALPSRAFDSPAQRQETQQLFAEYNRTTLPLSPELDSRFGELASQRIRRSPFRYYLWLPTLRVADMWLRPRNEALPIDPRWWQFVRDPRDSSISMFVGVVNLALVAPAFLAFLRGRVQYAWLFFAWVALRCLLLGTIESPETRYTLECFPLVFVFAAVEVASIPSVARRLGADA